MKTEREYKQAEILAADIIYALSEEAHVQCLAGLTDAQMIRVQKTIEKVLIEKE